MIKKCLKANKRWKLKKMTKEKFKKIKKKLILKDQEISYKLEMKNTNMEILSMFANFKYFEIYFIFVLLFKNLERTFERQKRL